MQITYAGQHSVIFGSKHSWEDWHLVPSSLPVIQPPSVNTNYVEVAGANGKLDLSDFPRGFPTYGNRSGSMEFYVDGSPDDWSWDTAYDEIMAYLHGFSYKMYLTDSPSYYYEGRFSVNQWKSDKHWSTITIDYDLLPFRKMRWTTTEEWLWNPFDFKRGLIIDRSSFIFTRDTDVGDWSGDPYPGTVWSSDYIGHMPVTPTFIVNSSDGNGMKIHYTNYNVEDDSKSINSSSLEFALPDGIVSNPQIMFSTPRPSDRLRFQISGRGQFMIDFRPGRL